MKKKSRRGFTFLGILLSLCLLFATACSTDLPGGESSSAGSAGASSGKTEGEQIRIGVTFQSLSMPTLLNSVPSWNPMHRKSTAQKLRL